MFRSQLAATGTPTAGGREPLTPSVRDSNRNGGAPPAGCKFGGMHAVRDGEFWDWLAVWMGMVLG
jgi:hypothetical protein